MSPLDYLGLLILFYFLGKKCLQGSSRADKEFTINPLLASRVIGICVQSSSKTHGAINSYGENEKYLGELVGDCGVIKVRKLFGTLAYWK